MEWIITWLIDGEVAVTRCISTERIARKYADMRTAQGFVVQSVESVELPWGSRMPRSLYTFTAKPGTDGIYFVHDAMSNLANIGIVARVSYGRRWIAIPRGAPDGERRYAFPTRGEAAHHLARFLDTGNREWIAP